MTEELRLWSIGESGDVEPLKPLQQIPTELELEELLVRHPDMLEPGLKLVGRQTPTQAGWLDLLAVDKDGRLVVYELKRGSLVKEAVTQVLAYASDLDAMTTTQLAAHIADRSGNYGIEGIDDFDHWYGHNFGGDDLSHLLPPRMVLVGLGVDPAAERIARFISGGPVDISVITFHGFARDGERLLARQLEVEPGTKPKRQRRTVSTAERRAALREYLATEEYEAMFDQVHADIKGHLPKQGCWEQPGSTGIGFQLTEPDDSTAWKTYFGVYAGYLGPGTYSVSILPQAIHWGGDAFEGLGESVALRDWPHGGYVLSFKSSDEWDGLRPAVLEFVNAVMRNRSASGEVGT
ncbi:MAG: endonuclease NucS [Gemmatimonadetes bacterium]|nr:endonuclease NucS [Gemmatimonadota bacterium]